jgi:hypothetical protein
MFDSFVSAHGTAIAVRVLARNGTGAVHDEEEADMKRALIVIMISGTVALSIALPRLAFGAAAQLAGASSTPEATADSTLCPSSIGRVLAQRGQCCQRQGVCGCRNGLLKCCDGTTANGCPCRGDRPADEAPDSEAR